MRTKSIAFLLGCAVSTPVFAEPTFENRSTQLGITHQYLGGWEHYVGGGIATFDCDGDSLPELFVAGGEQPAVLLRNETAPRGAELSFAENTPLSLQLTGVIGAYPLDVDADGFQDLVILRVGENALLQGGPDCSFTPFADDVGFESGDHWSTAFSATWEAGQSLPTLAIGNYVNRNDPEGPFEACDASFLYRPDGASYSAPLTLEPGFCSLSMLFSDWGRKGRQDLRVSNDRHYFVRGGAEQMWAMEDAPRLYGNDDNWANHMIWGMGIASRDISGDGVPEILLTSMGDQKLQSLDIGVDGPHFVDATFERGTTAHRPYLGDDGRPSTGWHAAFGDVQNDGRDDIFISKGNVEQMPSSAMKDPNNLLVQSEDGLFSEAGGVAGIGTLERSRGASFTDLNLDGLLDLVVVNRRAPLEIYQNTTLNTGNWLEVTLVQDGPNRDAVGAWIEVKSEAGQWTREITVGGGHASGSAGFNHFGLGDTELIRIRVVWPDGEQSRWQEVAVNRLLLLTRSGKDFAMNDV